MTLIITMLCFVEEINYIKKTLFVGNAMTRINNEEFFNFRFKGYCNENTNLIDDDIEKHSYGMIVGRYAYDGEEDINYVVLVQFTTINLYTLNDNPSKFDLPISPPVWNFTGTVKDPFSDDDDNSMFRLNKDIYNGYTKATSNTSVICTLKKKNKASYIEEAINKKPIVSVCGELLVCDGSIFNFPNVIEWNYQSNDNTDAQTDGGEKNKQKKKKRFRKSTKNFKQI